MWYIGYFKAAKTTCLNNQKIVKRCKEYYMGVKTTCLNTRNKDKWYKDYIMVVMDTKKLS